MTTDWNTIDDYFANRLPADERTQFEATLRTDTVLAEAVAFYVSARHTLQTEAHNTRRAELMARQPRLTRQLPWPYAVAAAACLALLLGIGWILWQPKTSPNELADAYIRDNLAHVSPTMGADTSNLQQVLALINKGEMAQADQYLANLLKREPTNADALKWAGVVSLRLGRYDKAIGQFQQLGRRTDLYANPGLFLEAIARMKRNQPNDKNVAKTLLENVLNQKLEGSDDAQSLLDKL